MTDAELIQDFLDGHEASFNLLLRRWQKRLYNFVLRNVGDRDEARDLCQQVFIRVHRRLAGLRQPERFSSWLYQIAANACLDWQRTRQAQPTRRLEDAELAGDVTDALPLSAGAGVIATDAAAQRRDVSNLLSRALQRIPAEQRVVVVMKEYQDLKFTEIAAILQIPVNTAKSRLYYGLKALKRVFDAWGLNKESMGYEL